MVTLYDVARLAGVSTATVSRVVHGQDRVRDSTRTRVLEVIEQLGYVPDGAAQSLSRRRKNVIGLVCVERQSPRQQYDIESMSLLFYDEILRGVEARIRQHEWSLLITYLREATDPDLPRLLSLSGQVDGLLIGEGIVPSEFLARLAKRLPVVVIAGDPGERAADVVTADNRSGSAALVSHLIEDARPAAAVPRGRAADRARRQGAAAGAARTAGRPPGLPAHRHVRRACSASAAARRRARSCSPHAASRLPDAVVCANDQMAIGVLQAFAKAGVRVPEQVAVVGFDDIFPGSLYDPPLTTVHQPMRLLGERACTRLLDRHRPAQPAPEGGAAAHRTRAALQLRLPARHRDPPAHPAAAARPRGGHTTHRPLGHCRAGRRGRHTNPDAAN